MIRANASLKSTSIRHAARSFTKPWICQTCRIHGSQRLSDHSQVSFPPVGKAKRKAVRIESSMNAEEKKAVKARQEEDHKKLVERLEVHLATLKESAARGTTDTRSKNRLDKAISITQDVVLKARLLSTTPIEWPLPEKRRSRPISLSILSAMQEAARKTFANTNTPDANSIPEESDRSHVEIPIDNKPVPAKKPFGKAKEKMLEVDAMTISPDDYDLDPIMVPQDVELRPLSHGLDRVLFNPGVTFLRDPRSRVYNFDPYLDKIMPVDEFDFDALGEYITSSKDTTLIDLARENGKKYVGSTSSMTGILSHLHYLISRWRPLNLNMLSKGFVTESENFTRLSRLPVSVILRWKDGVYAIDQDTETDALESILLFLGRSMEKMLTLPPEVFEKFHKSQSHEIPEEVKNARERYHYTTFGDLLFRSQLDACDDRLPGSGVFDLKTRAVVSVRMNAQTPQAGWGYQIKTADGQFESFEREYYDLIRAAFMKYSLQVRMGRMDGCFVAYHNTKRIFGFQYVSIDEMDEALHGSSEVGDQEFKLSLKLLNEALDRATQKYPNQSLRLWFETRESSVPFLYFAAEPLSDEKLATIKHKVSDINVVFEQLKKPVPWETKKETKVTQNGAPDNHMENDPNLSPLQELLTENEGFQEDKEEVDGSIMETKEILGSIKSEGVKEVGSEEELTSNGTSSKVTFSAEEDDVEESSGNEETSTSNIAESGEHELKEEELDEQEMEDLKNYELASEELEEVMGAEDDHLTDKAATIEKDRDGDDVATSAPESDTTTATTGQSASTGDQKDELFLQVLVTQNFVNGHKLERPLKLKDTDTWTLNYAFLNMEDSAAAKTIRQMKKRKEEALENDINWKSKFIKNLVQLSRDGESYSEKRRKEDEEGDIVVYRRRD